MRERYDELQLQAEAAFGAGALESAVELFDEAEQLASVSGDQVLADRAFCSRVNILIQLDRGAEHLPRLQHIILSSPDDGTRLRAAYAAAVLYDLDNNLPKALSYARRAHELVAESDDTAARASIANLAGTLALRECAFDDAELAFCDALESSRGADGYQKLNQAQYRDNLGYTYMCTDRLDEGIRLCEEARTALEAVPTNPYLHQTLQDLCYGYLLREQLDHAHECGERALRLAAEAHDDLVAKNCLFLLSEVAVRRGDAFGARRFLRELSSHYPETAVSDEIIDVFLATDLTTVVNLRG